MPCFIEGSSLQASRLRLLTDWSSHFTFRLESTMPTVTRNKDRKGARGKGTTRRRTPKPSRPVPHADKTSTAVQDVSKEQSANGRRPVPGAGSVSVRMYCQGLGDCFLVTFHADDGQPIYMLIDCGVILGTKNPQVIMRKVAESIKQTTGGHLHYLLATHEHWDHLSGFIQAQDVFNQMRIDNIWLAWTEDPTNQFANSLRAQRRKTLRALQAVASGMSGMAATKQTTEEVQKIRGTADQIQNILDFFGDSPFANGGGRGMAAKGANSTDAALNYLKGRKDAKLSFRTPGEPRISLPAVSGLRIYVLGPPENEMIKKSNPTAAKEVYELAGRSMSPAAAFFAAAFGRLGLKNEATSSSGLDGDDEGLDESAQPFERQYRRSLNDAQQSPFFQSRFFDRDDSPKRADQKWRRIDHDWLNTAAELALNLDSNTNNTSLVIAIELVPSGKVLLFAADAQVGNWMSWSQYSWPAEKSSDPPTKSSDLLKRTVFYKVGHHGSHNATMRAQGLELMESPDLVAFIPVNHEMAVKKHWGAMPFTPLLKRLIEKSRGRVVRIDEGLDKAPDGVDAEQWQAFKAQVGTDTDKLFYEWTVHA